MRQFAIINKGKKEIIGTIISKLPQEDKKIVFGFGDVEFANVQNVEYVKFPEEFEGKDASMFNFVSKYFFDTEYRGFVHVIQDSVEVLKDTKEFLEAIETMITKFKLKSWFNTITDICNYTFNIYNPRYSVAIDKEEAKKVYDKTVYWTSHSNTSWICYDYSRATYEDVRFEERFTIAMFYIIEYLARKRNTKTSGELAYMNMYPTIAEERGVFRLVDENENKQKTKEEFQKEQRTMNEENAIFQQMHVNNNPDMSVEQIIEDMYNVLVSQKTDEKTVEVLSA